MIRNSAVPTFRWQSRGWVGSLPLIWKPGSAERPHILPHGSAKGSYMKLPFEKRMYLIPAGCIAFILFFTVFGDKGLLRIFELKQDKTRIETRLTEAKNEN